MRPLSGPEAQRALPEGARFQARSAILGGVAAVDATGYGAGWPALLEAVKQGRSPRLPSQDTEFATAYQVAAGEVLFVSHDRRTLARCDAPGDRPRSCLGAAVSTRPAYDLRFGLPADRIGRLPEVVAEVNRVAKRVIVACPEGLAPVMASRDDPASRREGGRLERPARQRVPVPEARAQ